METTLKLNSLTATLYRWVYLKKQMPDSLCPYFWKVVIMYLFLIPYVLLSLPILIIGLFSKDFVYEIITEIKDRPLFGMIAYFLLLLLFSIINLILYFFDIPFTNEAPILAMGGITLIVSLAGLLALVFYHVRNKIIINRYEKHIGVYKTSNIVVEFVKASYKKYCPKINWK